MYAAAAAMYEYSAYSDQYDVVPDDTNETLIEPSPTTPSSQTGSSSSSQMWVLLYLTFVTTISFLLTIVWKCLLRRGDVEVRMPGLKRATKKDLDEVEKESPGRDMPDRAAIYGLRRTRATYNFSKARQNVVDGRAYDSEGEEIDCVG